VGKRVLVTGGAGFIGSHVCEELIAQGHHPVVLDNFKSGKRSNLSHLPEVEIYEGDAADFSAVECWVSKTDAVVHLAAEPSVTLSVESPISTHRANYMATLAVVEAVRKHPGRPVIYASSAAVYPAENAEAHAETDYPSPSSPYGLDKLSGEFLLSVYNKLYGLRSAALRFFNIYGERQDPTSPYSGVISIFVNRILADRPITIFGDGNQSRDFVYVRDLAKIITRALLIPETPALMNVGTGHSATLLELVAALEDVTGKTSDVQFSETRPGDIRISRADVSRLKAVFPMEMTDLSTGLARLVGSLSSNLV
jgi:UDP-glucose 4-epimerase